MAKDYTPEELANRIFLYTTLGIVAVAVVVFLFVL